MKNSTYDLLIGSHISFNAKTGFVGSVKEALSFNENAFMIYTGAPQNTIRKPLNLEEVKEGISLMQQNHILTSSVVVHAPYIINLCSEKVETREFAKQFLVEEIKRCNEVKSQWLVLHPGSRLSQPLDVALKQVVDGLNEVLEKTKGINVTICIETMAGKGSEVGVNIEQMATIVKGVKDQNRIAVCIDTCHISDEGYNLDHFDDYLNEFDQQIGIEKIKVVHLNDSKNPCGAHKDRHENLGYGYIGFNDLLKVAYHPKLNGIPKILETPWFVYDEKDNLSMPLYKQEVEMIRDKKWFDVKKEILAKEN